MVEPASSQLVAVSPAISTTFKKYFRLARYVEALIRLAC
jgi:hypothetical protein